MNVFEKTWGFFYLVFTGLLNFPAKEMTVADKWCSFQRFFYSCTLFTHHVHTVTEHKHAGWSPRLYSHFSGTRHYQRWTQEHNILFIKAKEQLISSESLKLLSRPITSISNKKNINKNNKIAKQIAFHYSVIVKTLDERRMTSDQNPTRSAWKSPYKASRKYPSNHRHFWVFRPRAVPDILCPVKGQH